MSAQRARSSIPAEHRSAHPDVPGVPWWAAVLIAATAAVAGIAFDAGSGSRELTNVFGALYLLGCLAAVLAVRQAGIFTAVVQPPLILFVAVPSAYFLFHHGEIHGIKDLLINCGYPLIERFLLMFFTSAIVLAIGLARWYSGAAGRSAAVDTAAPGVAGAVAGTGVVAGLRAKLTGLLQRTPASGGKEQPPSRRHAIDRKTAGAKAAGGRRPAAKRAAPGRSAPAPQPRRRRPGQVRDIDGVDADRPDDLPPARRRPRPPRDEGVRNPPPARARGRAPREPHDPYQPPMRGRSRQDRDDGGYGAYPYDDRYDPYEAPAPRRRSPGSGTHHPISNVRYRGEAVDDGDDHVEYRRRPAQHRMDADDWR